MKNLEWIRVGRKSPCPICQKPDWCQMLEDGSLVHCMRVQSGNPSKGEIGGWIHKIGDDRPRAKYIKPIREVAITIDAPSIFQKWQKSTDVHALIAFADKLGVEPMALHMMGCAWARESNAWAFPMKDAFGKVIGIRLRNEQGEKWAVKGSKSGIFYADDMNPTTPLFVVEGPTDTAATLCMNLYTLGRPSCLGNEVMINAFIRSKKIKKVVIIADADDAGFNGATKLQQTLVVPSMVITLPAKDPREFLKAGGTRRQIENMMSSRVWVNPDKKAFLEFIEKSRPDSGMAPIEQFGA